jgi:pyrroline-5-carboxylate reductase
LSRLVVVGGGRMGGALVGGLLAAGTYRPEEITVVDPDDHVRASLAERFGVRVVAVAEHASDAIVAVKPAQLADACRALGAVGVERLLSIVAGQSTTAIEEYLGAATRVIRSMPNTPALVGAGVSAISGGAHADESDLVWAESLLSSVGVVVRVPEAALDAVTGVSGSGPAYVFLVAEAMIEAGVAVGLDEATASLLVAGTLRGASELLVRSGSSPAALRAEVTSPGGTTAAAIAVLEENGVRAAFIDAIVAATVRSRELGSPGG